MTHDPDPRILSGPALAHVRSALMIARDLLVRSPSVGRTNADEMQAALDSLNSGQAIELSGISGQLPTDEYADGDIDERENLR